MFKQLMVIKVEETTGIKGLIYKILSTIMDWISFNSI